MSQAQLPPCLASLATSVHWLFSAVEQSCLMRQLDPLWLRSSWSCGQRQLKCAGNILRSLYREEMV